MRIVAIHGIDDLATDMRRITVEAPAKMSAVVRKNVEAGQQLAQSFAREAAGPHGLNYYKRISSEMTGPLEGEFGPEGDVAGRAVGAGWRNRPNNLDQDRAADVLGPGFAKDVGDEAEGWFW